MGVDLLCYAVVAIRIIKMFADYSIFNSFLVGVVCWFPCLASLQSSLTFTSNDSSKQMNIQKGLQMQDHAICVTDVVME